MKKVLWAFVLVLLNFQARPQSLVINEVVYSNKSILFDNDGDSPDWFELYNAGDKPVNLYNFCATDDTSKVDYWEFPGYELNPGEYLVVFASGKDNNIGNEIHTCFKLANMKESLFLVDPSGKIVDVIGPVCVPTDCSLARQPDGSGNLVILRPTPGCSNNSAKPDSSRYILDHLTINMASGFYNTPIMVTMSNEHSENTIMYTLDGNIPDEESQVFSNPIYMNDLTPNKNRFANIPGTLIEPGNQIFKANILRAVVYSGGCPASNEICNTYFINESVINHYNVPVVSLITDKDNLFDNEIGIYVAGNHCNYEQHGKDWEREVHLEMFDIAGHQISDQNAGMRIHGRGSRKTPQKSLRLYANTEYGNEYFQYPFFSQKPGINRFNVLLLRTTGKTLGTLFKDELCNYLVQDMNIDYAASETIILFINGEYWGIYNLMERQNKYYIENNYQVTNTGVDIIAYDRDLIVEEGSMDEYNNLLSWLQNADPLSEDFYEEISSKIDIDGLIDYFIAELYFANTDWPKSNVELWKIHADTARWRYFFFDSDENMMWLNYDHLTEYNNDIEDYQRFPEFSTILLKTLLKNEFIRKEFNYRFYHHLGTTFNASRVIDEINRFEKKYALLVPEHIYRWHDPSDYTKWEENVAWLRTFAIQRPMIVAEQLQKNFGNPYAIYPNPGTGDFWVDFFGPVEEMDIKAFSLGGELIHKWIVSEPGDDPVLVKTGLHPGFYILQIKADNLIYCSKLIVH